jgi:hypothetical protein
MVARLPANVVAASSTNVWDALSKMYSGKRNVMLVSQIEDTIRFDSR